MVFVLGVLAAACDGGGGGDGGPLEEYFQKAHEIQNDVWFAEPKTRWPPQEGTSGEEIAALARDAVEEGADGWRETSEAFAELDPPAEVEDAHNRLVQAMNASAEAFQAVADRLPDTVSVSGVQEAEEWLAAQYDRPEVNAAFMQLDEACFTLQGIADDNNIEIGLECEEEEG